jgi:hypothetical protein
MGQGAGAGTSYSSLPQVKKLEDAGLGYRNSPAARYDDEDNEHLHLSRALAFNFSVERENSMDLVNDPRFFQANVIEKRLLAFSGLSVVASLLLGSSVNILFTLKKDVSLNTPLGYCQLLSFCILSITAFSLATATFVQIQQVFYTYRLLTAGNSGFEQASLFYLNSTIVTWRHFAMRWMLRGLIFYMLGSGALVGVKFYKDAEDADKHALAIKMVAILQQGDTLNQTAIKQRLGLIDNEQPLDMNVHKALAAVVTFCFCVCAAVLVYIKKVHNDVFKGIHQFAYERETALTVPLREIQSGRSRGLLET